MGAKGVNWLYSRCARGTTVGVDAWIHSSFSEQKLLAPSSWGISEGENKFFDQGTVLLHGGARKITPFCLLVGSPGTTEFTPWFLSSLVSPVLARTFHFARKLASLVYKGIFSKFYLQPAIYSKALGQLPCETKAVLE